MMQRKRLYCLFICVLKMCIFKTVKVFAPQKSQWIHSYEKKKSAFVIVVISNVNKRKQYL